MSSKTNISIKNKFDRVVVLVDMDCFYCQVEEKLDPTIKGKPIAVVQYNPWQGGGIIAVNYPARAQGVSRHMRGDEAKQHCPEIKLPQVPHVRGKADLTRYREAGKEVAEVLKSFTSLLERASIDEAYLDITERVLVRIREMNEGKFQLLPDKLANTFVVGYENIGDFVNKLSSTFDSANRSGEQNSPDKLEYKKSDIKLLVGASIVNEIRTAVKEKTGYECSAGIAHNKILAKLTAGFHKPNKQTILPIDSIPKLYETLSLKKVKGLGGKLGDHVCEVLKIKFMSELAPFPESLLQQHFEERMGSWMYLIARGIDLEAVTAKFHSKSIGCCKRFPGKNAITGLATLNHWLHELATEVTERLEKDLDENNRTAKQLTVSYSQQIDSVDVSSTRSIPLVVYETERIAFDALDAIKRNTDRFLKANSTTALNNAIKFLGLSAGKFEPNAAGKRGGIKELFQNYSAKGINAKEGPRDLGQSKSETEKVVSESVNATTSTSLPTSIVENLPTAKQIKTKIDFKYFLKQPAMSTGTINICKDDQQTSIVADEESHEVTCSSSVPLEKTPDSIHELEKPAKDIKHFLQHQAVAGKNSGSNEKERKENGSLPDYIPADSNDVTSDALPEQMKPKKDIKYFLKQVASNAKENKEKNTATENGQMSNCSENFEIIGVPGSARRDEQKAINSNSRRENTLEIPPHSEEEKLPNYKETYAEFCFPPSPPEPVTVTKDCQQCGKKIWEKEYLSHLDFHFALALSQQQRDEFRNDLKSKLVSAASTSGKAVKSPLLLKRPCKTTTSSATGVSIERFLSKSASLGDSGNNSSASETDKHTKCPDCGKLIPLQVMSEHNDYHIAKRLQQELHRLEPPSQPASEANINTKRKRPCNGSEEIQLPTKQKLKPVSSYFSKL